MPQQLLYLRAIAEGSRDSRHVGSGHAAPDLLAELPDVGAGGVQVLQEDRQTRTLLTRRQERPQTSNFHAHAVQGALQELMRDEEKG